MPLSLLQYKQIGQEDIPTPRNKKQEDAFEIFLKYQKAIDEKGEYKPQGTGIKKSKKEFISVIANQADILKIGSVHAIRTNERESQASQEQLSQESQKSHSPKSQSSRKSKPSKLIPFTFWSPRRGNPPRSQSPPSTRSKSPSIPKSRSKSPSIPKSRSKSPSIAKSPSKSPSRAKSPSKSPSIPKSPSKSPSIPKSRSKSPTKTGKSILKFHKDAYYVRIIKQYSNGDYQIQWLHNKRNGKHDFSRMPAHEIHNHMIEEFKEWKTKNPSKKTTGTIK